MQDPPHADTPMADTPSLEEVNAQLRKRIAFLQEKLQIVGSITRHDVLNQLTAIAGYNELLGMMIEDPKYKAFLEKERTAIDKIRTQFQFAKDYQNIAAEPPRWQNIRNVALRASENLALNALQVVAETGTVSVLADPLLEKVFFQIIKNAVVHGGKATRIRIFFQESGGHGLLILENDGAGIPAGDKKKIFERGFGKGTGWGLFLAREILAVTGIEISETGDPANGVRFEITLPPGTYRTDGGPGS